MVAVIEKKVLVRKGIIALLRDRMGEFDFLEISGANRPLKSADPARLKLILIGCDHTQEEFDFFKVIIKRYSTVPVIILGHRTFVGKAWVNKQVLPYLKWGAMGYLSSMCDEAEFVKCIESVLKGQKYLDVDLLYNLTCFSRNGGDPQK